MKKSMYSLMLSEDVVHDARKACSEYFRHHREHDRRSGQFYALLSAARHDDVDKKLSQIPLPPYDTLRSGNVPYAETDDRSAENHLQDAVARAFGRAYPLL